VASVPEKGVERRGYMQKKGGMLSSWSEGESQKVAHGCIGEELNPGKREGPHLRKGRVGAGKDLPLRGRGRGKGGRGTERENSVLEGS